MIIKIPVALVVLLVCYLAGLSFIHRHNIVKPENERFLSPCPDKPNCVYSKASDPQHKIDAFTLLDNNPEHSWRRLIDAIQQAGGEILVDDGRYAHAVFTSTLFRYRDDLEINMGQDEIAVRSASRAGTSDLGANRKRVENIRSLYTTKKGV